MAGQPAKRFELLDKQTNKSTVDFKTVSDNSILNQAKTNPMALGTTLLSIATGNPAELKSALGGLKENAVGNLSRIATDKVSSVLSMTGIDPKLADVSGRELIKSIASGGDIKDALRASFGQLGSNEKLGFLKKFGINIPTGKCSASGDKQSLSDLIGSLTGGTIFAPLDKNSAAAGMAGVVDNANEQCLTGVFGLLSSVVKDKQVKDKAAALLAPSTIASGDLTRIADITSTDSSGAFAKSVPNPAASIIKNVVIPKDLPSTKYADLNDTLDGVLSNVDPNWKSADGKLSLANYHGAGDGTRELTRFKAMGIKPFPTEIPGLLHDAQLIYTCEQLGYTKYTVAEMADGELSEGKVVFNR